MKLIDWKVCFKCNFGRFTRSQILHIFSFYSEHVFPETPCSPLRGIFQSLPRSVSLSPWPGGIYESCIVACLRSSCQREKRKRERKQSNKTGRVAIQLIMAANMWTVKQVLITSAVQHDQLKAMVQWLVSKSPGTSVTREGRVLSAEGRRQMYHRLVERVSTPVNTTEHTREFMERAQSFWELTVKTMLTPKNSLIHRNSTEARYICTSNPGSN